MCACTFVYEGQAECTLGSRKVKKGRETNNLKHFFEMFLRISCWPSIDLHTCKFGFVDRNYLGIRRDGEKLNVESSGIHNNILKP